MCGGLPPFLALLGVACLRGVLGQRVQVAPSNHAPNLRRVNCVTTLFHRCTQASLALLCMFCMLLWWGAHMLLCCTSAATDPKVCTGAPGVKLSGGGLWTGCDQTRIGQTCTGFCAYQRPGRPRTDLPQALCKQCGVWETNLTIISDCGEHDPARRHMCVCGGGGGGGIGREEGGYA